MLVIPGTVFDVTVGSGFYGTVSFKHGNQIKRMRSANGPTGLFFLINRQDVWEFCGARRTAGYGERVIRTRCVCLLYAIFPSAISDWMAVDMLTPIDRPLDNLEDLTPEMSDVCFLFFLLAHQC